MIDPEDLSKICRRVQEISRSYDPTLTCDVFDATIAKEFRSIYPEHPPTEDQVGVCVVARMDSHVDIPALVRDLEQEERVWRVFLTFAPMHGLS